MSDHIVTCDLSGRLWSFLIMKISKGWNKLWFDLLRNWDYYKVKFFSPDQTQKPRTRSGTSLSWKYWKRYSTEQTTYESSQSQSPGSVPSIRLKLPVTKPFLSSRFDIWSTEMVILIYLGHFLVKLDFSGEPLKLEQLKIGLRSKSSIVSRVLRKLKF